MSDDMIPICDACTMPCERGERSWTDANGKRIRTICLDCGDREDLVAYTKTGRLTTHFMMVALLCWERVKRGDDTLEADKKNRRYQKPASEVELLNAAIKAFDRAVWLPFMRQQVDDEKVMRGMSFERDGLIVRTYVICGRAMVHFERGDAWVSAVTEEGCKEPRMGLQGIGATYAEAAALIGDAAVAFVNGAKLTPSESVGLG